MPNISKLTALVCFYLFAWLFAKVVCFIHSLLFGLKECPLFLSILKRASPKIWVSVVFVATASFSFSCSYAVCVCSIVCLRIFQSGDFPILISRWKLSNQSHSCQIIASSNKQVELQATSNEQLRELHYARILKETIAFLLAANSFEVVHFQEAEIFWRERNSTITDKIHSFSFRLRNSVNKKCFEQKNF